MISRMIEELSSPCESDKIEQVEEERTKECSSLIPLQNRDD